MIVMMGGPGTGKGTFSRMLREIHPEYTHIETGAILRAQPDGSPIRIAIAGGNLIPDEMVCDLIATTLAETPGDIILAPEVCRLLNPCVRNVRLTQQACEVGHQPNLSLTRK